ncbi:MAG: type II toxin-antitoxin system RelE/ParE family toxin [Aeromicrobium sp.]|nr:type II toxin-antitoxin system RelE/ParE family toxin [Burkholderiales bacterium]
MYTVSDKPLVKLLQFRGGSLHDLKRFPKDVKQEIGNSLDLVQRGLDPQDWKPLTTVGPGVRELRLQGVAGAFRTVYVVKFKKAIYVLHCFQKKTQATAQLDINIAQKRYRDLIEELKFE